MFHWDAGQRLVTVDSEYLVGAGKHLLWMDADIDFLNPHIQFLETHGFHVDKASDANAGMSLFHRNRYDLVILDEQISDKEDLLLLLGEIKARNAKTPVVLVTRNEEELLVEAAWGRSFEGWVLKPVNPTHLLGVCREVLRARVLLSHPEITGYVRDISEIKSNLLVNPTPIKWAKVYLRLCKWDAELQTAPSESLEEMHRTHKRELTLRFLNYVEENYMAWAGKKGGNPELHTRTFQRKVLPLLQRGEKCVLIVMSGMSLGQWLCLQKILEPWFLVETSVAWAPLPTEKLFCRTALFSGQMPREVSLDYPGLWQRLNEAAETAPYLRELLRIQLRKQGVPVEDVDFLHLRTGEDTRGLAGELSQHRESRLLVMVMEFMDMLGPVVPSPWEQAMRLKTEQWFQSSGMMEALRHFATNQRTVVLTSDHGSVRVVSPAEVFCHGEKSPHPRVKIGAGISCDDRQALFVESPSQYGLPGESGTMAYAIAKDRFYFVYPNKYQYFVTPYKDRRVSGGLSMEEMIVPLMTLTPR